MEAKKDYKSHDFYDPLISLLNNSRDRFNINSFKEGDYCIYFYDWREPYRIGEDIENENCLELIIGKLKNPNSMTFSEAIWLNTYHGSLRFSKQNLTWSRGSHVSVRELIRIDQGFYENIKNILNVENWKSNLSYEEGDIVSFVHYIESQLEAKESQKIKMDEKITITSIADSKNHVSYHSSHFFDALISMLINQTKTEKQYLNPGEIYLYYYIWREPYKVENRIEHETCLELIIGKLKNPNSLTFSDAYCLNTYQGSLVYSEGNMTWSRGSDLKNQDLIQVNPTIFERLSSLLKPHHWESPISYKERYITTFVRTLENYFDGKYFGKNFEIIQKEVLVKESKGQDAIISIWLNAPEIAEEAKPGQFVIIRLHQRGERIPLTIADTDKTKGQIRLIYQVIGKTTKELSTLEKGERILDLLGPLGEPVEIKKYSKPVLCVAGGVGLASILSKAKAIKQAGNYLISIIGAKSKDILILEEEMRRISDELYITTDDGLYQTDKNGAECFHRVRKDGTKVYGGFVNYVVEALLGNNNLLNKDNTKIEDPNKKFLSYGPASIVGKYLQDKIAEIIAVGPIPMMWSVVNVTANNGKYIPHESYNSSIPKTLVSLNPVMVDGTGMCGGCRVRLYNPEKKQYETKFACVDGPVFNGHLVDFDSLVKRVGQYTIKEKEAIKYLEMVGW